MISKFLLAWVVLGTVVVDAQKPLVLNHIVLGYSASWRDEVSPVQTYNFGAMKFIARSFLHPNPDGSVDVPPAYFNPQLEVLAHQHGVKLLMSAGGEAEKADNWVSMATHPDALQKHLDALAGLMAEHHYDGVDVDWEPAPTTTPESVAYSIYLKALRARFPQAVLTTALPASDFWIGHVTWPDVLASVDYINVMTYDYAGGWGGVAGHGSNLFPPGDYTPTPGYSASEGIENLLQNHHIPPAKLLMGMTFWGYRFRADKIGGTFPANTPGYSDGLTYGQTQDLLGTGGYLSLWDQRASMPYLRRTAGGSIVCYENPESIRRKCEYAAQLNCAGVMIWHVGADEAGPQAPLMDALSQSFGGHAAVLDRSALEQQIKVISDSLDHHNKAGAAPTAMASLSAMSVEQLQSMLAQLRARRGIQDDQQWQAKKPMGTAK